MKQQKSPEIRAADRTFRDIVRVHLRSKSRDNLGRFVLENDLGELARLIRGEPARVQIVLGTEHGPAGDGRAGDTGEQAGKANS